nr:TonB-dependent receptor plug domain-containing protein [Acetobacter persici]
MKKTLFRFALCCGIAFPCEVWAETDTAIPAEQKPRQAPHKASAPRAAKATKKTRDRANSALESVVVTAQRRAENNQTVPISIQHIDGKTLANAGYTALTDLQYLAPGVQYDPTQGAAFQIRGVGSESFDFSNAKSVSVVVDDVVMDAQRANGMIGMVDINNVDIMMGPQHAVWHELHIWRDCRHDR